MPREKKDYPALRGLHLPNHVAIIMDGNGRWAKQRLLPRSKGHLAGAEMVKTIVRMSSDVGIAALTLYAFSTENWKRPKDEVSVLMKLVAEYLRRELAELHEEHVCFTCLGDVSALPGEVRQVIEQAQRTTRANKGLRLNIAINYGGRAELVMAANMLAQKVAAGQLTQIDEQAFAAALYTAGQPEVDFVIRTSGEQRLSNFLPFQAAYAELYFTPTYWPDFDEEAYAAALIEFASRTRRFGGL